MQGYFLGSEASLQLQLGKMIFGPTTGLEGTIADDLLEGGYQNIDKPAGLVQAYKAGQVGGSFDNPYVISASAGAIVQGGLGVDAKLLSRSIFYWGESL